jgi:uncharacterized protein (DUF983 family)
VAYVNCEHCGRQAFTTAYWSSTDYCDYCGQELPHPRSVVDTIVTRPATQFVVQTS